MGRIRAIALGVGLVLACASVAGRRDRVHRREHEARPTAPRAVSRSAPDS